MQPLRNQLKQLEKQLDELTGQQSKLENILADPVSYLDENKQQLKQTLVEKSDVDNTLEKVETEWMELSETYETKLKGD